MAYIPPRLLSWLDETGAPMKVQQELMRHASIQTSRLDGARLEQDCQDYLIVAADLERTLDLQTTWRGNALSIKAG